MYDTILVPIDGSDPSDAAVEHARSLAADQDATVHVLHANEFPARMAPAEPAPATVLEDVRAESEELVASATERLTSAGVDAEGSVAEGMAPEAVSDYVDDHDVDLVVMGTHGRTGAKRILLGSTTERALRTADAPVLAVEAPP